MTAMKHTVTGLALSFGLFAFANATLAADNGLKNTCGVRWRRKPGGPLPGKTEGNALVHLWP